MPLLFKIGGYAIYFWLNEGLPREPIHIHISAGTPSANATKVWITKDGKCILAHNRSRIPERALNNILEIIETNAGKIISEWKKYFGEVRFYC